MNNDVEQYYGLHRPLFAPVRESYDVFEVVSRKLLLDEIVAELAALRPVISIEGERGVGKSTLASALAMALQARRCSIVQVMSTLRDPMQVQRLLGGLFGMAEAGVLEPAQLLQAAAAAQAGPVVLLVDDADQLAEAMFRHLWLLVKLFENADCRIQLVLIGGLEEWVGLDAPDLAELRRCIEAQRCILPFTAQETEAYLDFKMRSAGRALGDLVDGPGLVELVERSDGNPSHINLLTERALTMGRRRHRRRLTRATVREAALPGEAMAPRRFRHPWAAVLALGVVCGIGGGAYVGTRRPPDDDRPVVAASVVAPVPSAAPPLGSDFAAMALPPPPAPSPLLPDDPASNAALAAKLVAPMPGRRAPGLVLVAQSGDTMPTLFAQVYRGLTPPPYADFVALNQGPLKPGSLVVFPTPPMGWPAR